MQGLISALWPFIAFLGLLHVPDLVYWCHDYTDGYGVATGWDWQSLMTLQCSDHATCNTVCKYTSTVTPSHSHSPDLNVQVLGLEVRILLYPVKYMGYITMNGEVGGHTERSHIFILRIFDFEKKYKRYLL